MASGKIELPHFKMDYSADYSQWFTPATNFVVSQATIRHIERNIYYLYINGYFTSDGTSSGTLTDSITAYTGADIGTINKTYFGPSPDGLPITGYVSALVAEAANSSKVRSAAAGFTVSGSVQVRGANFDTCYATVNGIVIRREV